MGSVAGFDAIVVGAGVVGAVESLRLWSSWSPRLDLLKSGADLLASRSVKE